MKTIRRITGTLACCLALTACPGEQAEGAEETPIGPEVSGDELEMYGGPVSGDPALGEPIFANNCAGCHPGVGPDLQAHGARPAEVRLIVREGEDRMPAFGQDKISDEDLENVLAYLQSSYAMFQ